MVKTRGFKHQVSEPCTWTISTSDPWKLPLHNETNRKVTLEVVYVPQNRIPYLVGYSQQLHEMVLVRGGSLAEHQHLRHLEVVCESLGPVHVP